MPRHLNEFVRRFDNQLEILHMLISDFKVLNDHLMFLCWSQFMNPSRFLLSQLFEQAVSSFCDVTKRFYKEVWQIKRFSSELAIKGTDTKTFVKQTQT